MPSESLAAPCTCNPRFRYVAKRLRALLAGLALVGPMCTVAGHLPGRVVRVLDGDRIVIDQRGVQTQIALAGIDAPELNQPWGQTAAAELYRTLGGAFVVVETATGNRNGVYGRIVFESRDIALDLLRLGLAWSTEPRDPGDARPHPYNVAEESARAARRGLWSDPTPIPPWEWRRHGPDAAD